MPDRIRQAYDELLNQSGGKGARQEMGTVRQSGFRRPKDQTGWSEGGKK